MLRRVGSVAKQGVGFSTTVKRNKMNYIEVLCENQVARLTIQRPQVLNALNIDTVKEITSALYELQNMSPRPRVLVITGSGEKAFVAGADIQQINKLDAGSALEFAREGQKMSRLLETLPFPAIAMVN